MTTAEPPADELTVVRCHLAGGAPGLYVVVLCRASLAARLVEGADAHADQVEDLGPHALPAGRLAESSWLARNQIRHVGIARGGRWLAWFLPGPAEEVPSW